MALIRLVSFMSSKYQPAFLLISILLPAVLQAQDSVIFKNDQYLVGEIKGMSRAVLTMETEFSDQDFQIEWDKVQEIYTQSEFLISLEDGRQYNGDLQGIAPDSITLNTNNFGAILVKLIDIVYLEGIGKGFKDRFERALESQKLPIPISEVRAARNPLVATAKGALLAAMYDN